MDRDSIASDTPANQSMQRSDAEFVKRIALHLLSRLPPSVQLDDLIQAGMIGLIEARRSYLQGSRASFETFAGIRVRGAMLDELRRYDWTPRSVHRKARAISEAIRSIEARTGRDARDAEVASEIGMSVPDYHQTLQDSLACRVLSIEQLCEAESPHFEFGVASRCTQPVDELARERFAAALEEAISGLPDRERRILALYYEQGKNLKEIGMELGISESRVSQIQSQAILRLRARLVSWMDSGTGD